MENMMSSVSEQKIVIANLETNTQQFAKVQDLYQMKVHLKVYGKHFLIKMKNVVLK
jgi:hypothetical protein